MYLVPKLISSNSSDTPSRERKRESLKEPKQDNSFMEMARGII